MTTFLALPAAALLPGLSLRTHLIHWLSLPDVAVLALGLGAILLLLECNLPGAILPGAAGLLLLLSGIYGLSLSPLRPASLALLIASLLALLLSMRSLLLGIPAVTGTLGLALSLFRLVDPARTPLRIHTSVAISVGLLVGLAAAILGRIAHRARRNKAVSPAHHPVLHASAQSRSSVD